MTVVVLTKSLMESKLAHALNERLVNKTPDVDPHQFKDLKQFSLEEARSKEAKAASPGTGTKVVEATVTVVVSEFKQVRVTTDNGHRYAITASTPGIDWSALQEGQRIQCTVTTSKLPRVVKASVL